nr:MAG TPA: hypothetical protein [Caudoviricetes sp.]
MIKILVINYNIVLIKLVKRMVIKKETEAMKMIL